MVTKKRLLSATLALSLLWMSNQAEAKEKKFKGTFSGSYISTEVDTDGNGEKGSVVTLRGTSTLGSFSEQAVVESNFTGGTDTTCPSGNPGREYSMAPGTGHFVNRFDNGDLLWGEIPSETFCYDAVTTMYSFIGQFVVTGGTGKYQGATGSGTFNGTAKHLFLYPADTTGRYFGEETGTFDGTVTLP